MTEEWKTYKLEDIASIKSGKRLPKGHVLTSEKTEFRYLRLVDIKNNEIQESEMLFLERDTQRKIARYIVNKNDVCLAIVGHTIGIVFYIGEKFDGVNLTENAARLTDFSPKVNSKFIYYYLLSPVGYQKIISRKVGSAQGKLPLYNIKNLELSIPPLPEQRAIASILSALDDKIELNLQMNKTLEEMAMTLYKHWFVDFGPFKDGEFVASELGEIPKGWEVKTLGEEFKITIGRTPPRNEHEWFSSEEGIKWVSIRDMGIAGAYIFTTSEYLTETAVESKSVPKIPANTVILSFKLTVGRVSITTEEMVSNEAIAHFINKSGTTMKSEYLYLALKSFDYNSLASTSSIATAVNSQTVKGMRVIVPSISVIEEFDREVFPLFNMIKSNSEETQTLTTLRDTLLPKLISGEVCIKDAARSLAEVL